MKIFLILIFFLIKCEDKISQKLKFIFPLTQNKFLHNTPNNEVPTTQTPINTTNPNNAETNPLPQPVAVCSKKEILLPNLITSISPNSISINWINPTMDDGCSIKSILVVRKINSQPTSQYDGTIISSGLTSFTDNSANPATFYNYKIFIINNNDEVSDGVNLGGILGLGTTQATKIPNNSINIDGLDTDSAWANAPTFNFDEAQSYNYSNGQDPRISGRIKLAYDDNNLYIYIYTNDKFIFMDNPSSNWLDDRLEFYFDGGFNRSSTTDSNDRIFTIAPRNPNADPVIGTGNGSTYSFLSDTTTTYQHVYYGTMNDNTDLDTGWAMEIKIPFSTLGISSITKGQSIGFSFGVGDDDFINHSNQHSYNFLGNGMSWVNPSTWGICTF